MDKVNKGRLTVMDIDGLMSSAYTRMHLSAPQTPQKPSGALSRCTVTGSITEPSPPASRAFTAWYWAWSARIPCGVGL